MAPKLGAGLYEKLITETLDRMLAGEFDAGFVECDELDRGDAHVLLARHVYRLASDGYFYHLKVREQLDAIDMRGFQVDFDAGTVDPLRLSAPLEDKLRVGGVFRCWAPTKGATPVVGAAAQQSPAGS